MLVFRVSICNTLKKEGRAFRNIGKKYRGYYTVARRYEFYFRVAKQYFRKERTSSRRVMFFLLYRQKDIDKIIDKIVEGNYYILLKTVVAWMLLLLRAPVL